MSVYFEVERLRSSLRNIQMPDSEASQICGSATDDISQILLDIVSNAVSEAVDYAVELGADKFVDDIQVLPDAGGLYRISTHSGTADYSKPRQEMLPSLLKNAKTSSDGNRYKVIPMRGKETKVERSMFSALQERQDAIDTARTVLREQAKNKKHAITDALGLNLSKQVAAAKMGSSTSTQRSGEVEFRTASDKQDAGTSWVIPEKEADMTEYLQNLNNRILDTANGAIQDLMRSYYRSYVGEQWHM